MDDYIERRAVRNMLDAIAITGGDAPIEEAIDRLDKIPAVNVAPVKGRAFWTGNGVQRCCSYCGMPVPTTAINGDALPEKQLHYCYWCGRRMGVAE